MFYWLTFRSIRQAVLVYTQYKEQGAQVVRFGNRLASDVAERNNNKPRTCRKCGDVFNVTAKQIKETERSCQKEVKP